MALTLYVIEMISLVNSSAVMPIFIGGYRGWGGFIGSYWGFWRLSTIELSQSHTTKSKFDFL